MRICVVASWWPTATNPTAGIFIRDQVEALETRHSVDVIYPGRVFPVRRLEYSRATRAAEAQFKKIQKPDLIHAHVMFPGGLAAIQLGRKHHIPVILSEYLSPFSEHVRDAWQGSLAESVLSSVESVVALGPTMLEEIHAFSASRRVGMVGRVVPPIVDTDFFQAPPASNSSRFLFLGNLTERKGAIYLLHAASLLPNKGLRGFTVTVAGDGPQKKALERFAKDYGLSDVVDFFSFSIQRPLDRIKDCTCLVAPSLNERFCLVAAEALSCGREVIATRCGGPEGFVPEATGQIVEPGDVGQLAKAMERHLNRLSGFDPVKAREVIVRRFGARSFLGAIETIYSDAIASFRVKQHRGSSDNYGIPRDLWP